MVLEVPHQKVRSPWQGTRSDRPVDCTRTSLVLPLQPVRKWVDASAENAVLGRDQPSLFLCKHRKHIILFFGGLEGELTVQLNIRKSSALKQGF